jgi:hypothetical protein
MKNFAKGTAFFVFGVLLSPILLGLFAPAIIWKLTSNELAVIVSAIISFSVWAVIREWMIKHKWHYHI